MWHTVDVFSGRSVLATSLVICLAFAVAAPAETLVVAPVTVQPPIQISADLRPSIDAMLQASQTFRRQYARILTTPRLVIHARVDSTLLDRNFRARSTIRRYNTGLLVVVMEISPGSNPTEWIAHEFEHVLEQLDHLDLRALADRFAWGTWYSGSGMIETSRAMRAGRAVLREVREHRRHPDKYVE